jgi:hypothetical protein
MPILKSCISAHPPDDKNEDSPLPTNMPLKPPRIVVQKEKSFFGEDILDNYKRTLKSVKSAFK